MPVFAYTASNALDQAVAGTLIADTPADGRERLRARGLAIVAFRPAVPATPRRSIHLPLRARQREQVAESARLLSLLLRAGVPLAEALDVLARQSDRRLGTLLKDVRDRIDGGASLTDALAAHDRWFDGLFLSAVRMGELSGQLDEALSELAEHLQASQALRHRVTAALTYPLILIVVGIGVVIFLMSYVVPQLLTVLSASGRPLPASTMLLKGFSDTLVQHGLLLLAVVAGLAVAVAFLRRRSAVRRVYEKTIFKVPVLGPLLKKNLIAQFAQQITLLLRTGIPFVDAVRNIAGQTAHLLLKEELHAIADAVESGSDIAPTLSSSRVFPPVVAHLVAVGQESGELTSMLAAIRTRYDTEVQWAVGRFTAALEPVLIVLLAAAVGFVVFACLMPILEVTRGLAG